MLLFKQITVSEAPNHNIPVQKGDKALWCVPLQGLKQASITQYPNIAQDCRNCCIVKQSAGTFDTLI